MSRIFLVTGSLFGAGGVALSAAASHVEALQGLRSPALILLVHGTLLFSLALHMAITPALKVGAAVLAFGTALFITGLLVHALYARHLFSGAAPLGGSLMIIGWLVLGLGAFQYRKKVS